MPRMNGGEALVRSLAAEGLRAVFGVPGAGQYEAIDALYSTPSIRYIAVRTSSSSLSGRYARQREIAAAWGGRARFFNACGSATAYATSSLLVSRRYTTEERIEHDETAWLGP